jgi:hypothetical protein
MLGHFFSLLQCSIIPRATTCGIEGSSVEEARGQETAHGSVVGARGHAEAHMSRSVGLTLDLGDGSLVYHPT